MNSRVCQAPRSGTTGGFVVVCRLASLPLALSLSPSACSSSSSGNGGAPDASQDVIAIGDDDSGHPLDASGDVNPSDAPHPDDASDGGAQDETSPSSGGTCNGAACGAGCTCLVESHNGRMACMCPSAPQGSCVTTNCGSILCQGWCFDDAGTCVHPEGADASADDGGPLCATDGGSFPGTPGTCGGQTCAPGCDCVNDGCGQGTCMCAAGPVDPSVCVAPTCGDIFCGPGCTCGDAGECSCP